jgi:L-threonylcarbamoyladenylate synthase
MDDPGALRAAADALTRGGVVLVPTDTVYGIAVRPGDPAALERVFRAKARPTERQVPVLAASVAQVEALGVEFKEVARELARRYWPGALTMAFGFDEALARPSFLEGRKEVAVRIPDLDFLRLLLEETGVLLVTSANAHGTATPADAAEAARSLREPVDVVVDAGPLVAQPSTLVNVAVDPPVVERPGPIPADELRSLGLLVPSAAE